MQLGWLNKLQSILSVLLTLQKAKYSITLLLMAIIALVGINFKKNIMNYIKGFDFFEAQAIAEYYNRKTDNEVANKMLQLAKHIPEGVWAVQGMHNVKIFDFPYNTENWSFVSRIIYLKEYNYATGEVDDARGKRKDKSRFPIAHNEQTLEANKKRAFTNGVDFELTADYISVAGGNVETMFQQFWFNPYAKAGSTVVGAKDQDYSLRTVIMLDKQAFESMEGTHDKKRDLLQKYAEEITRNHVKSIK
jgi:hypothetical protein